MTYKKLFCILLVPFMFTGCGSIKKQNNINKEMESYVFQAPAADVYAAAEKTFSGMYTPIKSTGKNTGSSEWLSKETTFSGKKFLEKSRFTVEVASKSKTTSTARVFREAQSNMTGKWGNISRGRVIAHEFYILQRVNPSVAKAIEERASK